MPGLVPSLLRQQVEVVAGGRGESRRGGALLAVAAVVNVQAEGAGLGLQFLLVRRHGCIQGSDSPSLIVRGDVDGDHGDV